MSKAIATSKVKDVAIHHLFDPPARITRLQDSVRASVARDGWLTPAQARTRVDAWMAHAEAQGRTNVNANKIVLSLFDLTGQWAQPWADAGYQVFCFDIQNDPDMGDVNKFSVEFFNDWFNAFDGLDVHAILAACPCTDFAVSGARHFAAKDADGRTALSVELVQQTIRTVEFFRPAIWAVENPVGRIGSLTDLPAWRMSLDPNHFGETYTKKTILWGRFNAGLPIAPCDPVEGSKMWSQYGGKSQRTKNARSATPLGFAYSFFMANNAADHPILAVSGKYDRLDARVLGAALTAGLSEDDISSIVDDFYYMDLDDEAAECALREAAVR